MTDLFFRHKTAVQKSGVAAAVSSCTIEAARKGRAGLAKKITLNAQRPEAGAMAWDLVEVRGAGGGLKGVSCYGGAGQGDCQNGRSLGELRVARLGVDHGSRNGVGGKIHIKTASARKFADLGGRVDRRL